ncbi:2-dehydropantoate 2-reductase [Guyparkeria hydrothermalis]|uniref:2-dehydropantoate 2-reductase n=1 Tax=Guyparkeria hydrothermalis TaxID=923 RepID=UPI002020C61A|nr:2-dehydropantoate 2-reductase [Guyparkeria hydrothermalis]MCL7743483.1 2-dehydropantoate 2-reductase [Guyparkeria hydrothermalis]
MTQPFATEWGVIGAGEIGGVLAHGLLKTGHPVFPIGRETDIATALAAKPDLDGLLVAVGEKDLDPVLEQIPSVWFNRLVLIQNELLPGDWRKHGIETPTVASIWFEKKPGKPVKPLVSSPVHGPKAEALVQAMQSLDIPAHRVDDADEMLEELAIKNVYILTTNIAGLETGGDVEHLWSNHQQLARDTAADVIRLQEAKVGRSLDHQRLIDGMVRGFDGDPQHQCMGRSAPQRMARALAQAGELGVDMPAIKAIADKHR